MSLSVCVVSACVCARVHACSAENVCVCVYMRNLSAEITIHAAQDSINKPDVRVVSSNGYAVLQTLTEHFLHSRLNFKNDLHQFAA